MRKTHYKVTLDVLICSDEGINVMGLLKESTFLLEVEDQGSLTGMDIHDIVVDDIEVVDSR